MHNPLQCPACQSDTTVAGQPYWKAEGDDAETIVKCEACKHEWTLTLAIVQTIVR